jgi:hypothetical protein
VELTLDRLIRKGFFSSETIPEINTNKIADKLQSIELKASKSKDKCSKTVNYSVPKVTHARRNLSIPNPLHQIRLCQGIIEHWTDINEFFASSDTSLTKPVVDPKGDKALIREHHFNEMTKQRILNSSDCQHHLKNPQNTQLNFPQKQHWNSSLQ